MSDSVLKLIPVDPGFVPTADPAGALTKKQLTKLGEVVGCSIRKVWAHY